MNLPACKEIMPRKKSPIFAISPKPSNASSMQHNMECSNSHQLEQELKKLNCHMQRASYDSIMEKVWARVHRQTHNHDNLMIYPICMGPHYVYTLEHPLEKPTAVCLAENLMPEMRAIEEAEYQQMKQINRNNQQLNESIFGNTQQQSQSSEKQQEQYLGIKAERESSQGKYRKYSLEFKKKIVEEVKFDILNDTLKKHSPSHYIHAKAKQYAIAPKNVYRWVETDDLCMKESGRKAKYPQLEKKLLEHMMNHPRKKRRELLIEAKVIMDQMGEEYQDFSFSKGWFERFKKRHKIGKLSSFSEQLFSPIHARLDKIVISSEQQI